MKLRTLGRTALAAAGAVAVHDVFQREHAVLRNFPLIGHTRYLLERLGPELRQYIVADNDEERPFSRDQRRWVYASAKKQNNHFGFGTDADVEHRQGKTYLKHRTFAATGDAGAPVPDPAAAADAPIPSTKVLGGPRDRRFAFRPGSVVNISGMSFGSLSGAAVAAMGKGAALAGCLHNTGEGGVSVHHEQGQDLIVQLGTAYFGCRNDDGSFDLPQLKEILAEHPVKAIEVKLSQGAKPGLGGFLPGDKVTEEIARARGVAVGEDCASPSRHAEFGDVDSMLDFVEMLAGETGLPVGIKSAVGEMSFWDELASRMADEQRGVDFVTIDGGEGGTGAAPLIFTDSVALPFRMGFARVRNVFAERGVDDGVTFIGSGKLGLPENAAVAFALGADMVNVGREAMLAVGCIQAQKCHTDDCPTGVATQNPWLVRGLDPESKGERCADYIRALRKELRRVSGSLAVSHPSEITPDDIEVALGNYRSHTLRELYG